MTLLFASDLDRTLIYSRAALDLGEPVDDPVCVEVYDGSETSFVTRRALAALADLSRRLAFVPVTTRTLEQYRRIRLHGVRTPYAVTTNGARILRDGVPCPDWAADVARRLAEVAPYAEARARLAEPFGAPWVRKRRDAEQVFCYCVVDAGRVEPGWLAEVEAVAASLGWVVSAQGRKVYAIPATLTKRAALAEIAERAGARHLAAAGDSLLDRGILELADLAIRPAHGELHAADWHCPGLVVTEHAGGRAAEDILALVRPPAQPTGTRPV